MEMEYLSTDSINFCNNLLKYPKYEYEICSFFAKIIKDMFNLYHPTFENIRKSLKNIRSFKNSEVEVHDIVSFEEKTDRLSYIFAYCFIHSVVMYEHFSDMLKSNPTMLSKIISMTKLRLCLLGGGPGFEAVSVCKILSILKSQNEVKSSSLLLNITVIDVCKDWEKDAEFIMQSALKEMYISSNIKVDFKFIEADLTDKLSDDVKKALKKAHIVTMFKFLSDVNQSSYKISEVPHMIHNIIDCMSFKACLFFLDNAGGDVFKKTDRMIDKLEQMSRIYKTNPYNCHKLSLDSLEMVSQTLGSIFRYLACTPQTTITCSAWLKIRHAVSVTELKSGISAMSLNNSINDPEEHELKIKDRKTKVKKIFQSAQGHSEHNWHLGHKTITTRLDISGTRGKSHFKCPSSRKTYNKTCLGDHLVPFCKEHPGHDIPPCPSLATPLNLLQLDFYSPKNTDDGGPLLSCDLCDIEPSETCVHYTDNSDSSTTK